MTDERRIKLLYGLFYVVTFVVLGTTPTFDYHRLLLPSAERAEVQCVLQGITVDHDIDEYALAPVGYAKRDTVMLYLYATVVTRTMRCHYVQREPPAAAAPAMVLHYTQHYLNVSHIDVDHQLQLMRQRYGEPVRRWRYNQQDYVYLLRDAALDRHGLAEQPIDIYKDYASAYIVIKLCLFLATSLIVLLVLALWALWSRHRQLLTALTNRWRRAPSSVDALDCDPE